MMRRIFAVASMVAVCTFYLIPLSGCADWADQKDLEAPLTNDLCAAYFSNPSPSIKTELERRNAVRTQDWPLIDTHSIGSGMNECAVEAAWGETFRRRTRL
jgi:hypothetical protein